jgi:Uma2 family endonuclease
MAVQHNDWISPEEYLRIDSESLDIKYEYDDGHMYAMSGGSTSHSLLAGNMFTILRSHLRGGPCKVYTSDMRVYVSELQFFYPDVSVSCDPEDTQAIKDNLQSPRLIVEVLSPSTEMRDRTRKFAQYQRCPAIQEYVLVSQKRQEVEVFMRNGKKWIYQLFSPGEDIELLSLNIQFPIAMLYEDVPLPVEEE